MHMEANTDRFFRYEMYQKVDVVRAIVANHVGANEEDIVFVINASHGVNAILRSLLLPSGSKFLYFNLAYTMVKNTLYYISEEFQNQLVEVNVTFPVSYSKIVGQVVEALEKNPEVKVACFSHITSVPALILPIKELTEECHKRGVMVLVDGAHAMGQIPINITDLGADFYLSNGHKWFYTLKGSAFLWVKKELQPLISPTVISFEGEVRLQREG
jgi:selenocysteine lyase/cysteine desulfurase